MKSAIMHPMRSQPRSGDLQVEGYVLAGGRSSRFGSDKATHLWGGRPMALWVAEALSEHACPVTLVGVREIHGVLGLPLIQDSVADAGPLGGIVAALANAHKPWCLIAACDMPRLASAPLGSLVRTAERTNSQAILVQTPDRQVQPLCGLYATAALEPLNEALSNGIRKVTDALNSISWEVLETGDSMPFTNINRPEDLTALPTPEPLR